MSTLSGFSMSSGPDKPLEPEPADDFKEDPFKSKYRNITNSSINFLLIGNSNADPFGGGSEDPFKAGMSYYEALLTSTCSLDPFTNKSDPFSGSDPFKVCMVPNRVCFLLRFSQNADPFKENDPFKSPTTNFPRKKSVSELLVP